MFWPVKSSKFGDGNTWEYSMWFTKNLKTARRAFSWPGHDADCPVATKAVKISKSWRVWASHARRQNSPELTVSFCRNLRFFHSLLGMYVRTYVCTYVCMYVWCMYVRITKSVIEGYNQWSIWVHVCCFNQKITKHQGVTKLPVVGHLLQEQEKQLLHEHHGPKIYPAALWCLSYAQLEWLPPAKDLQFVAAERLMYFVPHGHKPW